MLCDRLNKIYQQALVCIKEEEQLPSSVPIAIQLGLRKPPDIRVDEYYPTFLSMAKNFMEGIHTFSIVTFRCAVSETCMYMYMYNKPYTCMYMYNKPYTCTLCMHIHL